ncbi:GPI-anchored cell wall organization protein-domain-containing protein [Aspergillus flavus]|uniref:GPI-anchored cell wall organization protein-domain-containing protein n=3 Tax=Aspergillus subgen. Circumdati TaxID=2720871 RepID=B8NA16_ASPFN|nr:uncharacterized protein G4B84_004983 [Aspergillus flavus NRRL3357]KAJ1707323.1 GPI-anchored cell wall organization protein Ecm33 [Aspergillus flavus]KOC18310.1 GPI-anchored cell wall organization protein [Aspergillus flavus AF70]OOO14426.1 hypothetical protein OAory_01030210 [Aspergillus oryzae]QMW29648.1 hypothetical protein G4B84_004983 [Aspergillus flavus NRRL3357]QMW41720.1 hypothetical protein G4B11_005044 [Aspergillus flavus]
MFIKYALPALAAAQAVFAASDKCGSGDTIKIENQSDADGYSSCSTLKGDVEISGTYSGDLQLNGVKQISGGLSCDGASNMTGLSASSLNSIGDTFKLTGLTTLTTLSFAALTKVGSIEFTALPQLQSLDFTKGVTEAGSVVITNTGLSSLNGISLETVGGFDITENTNLKTVNVNNLKNATALINFAGNMDGLEIEFPNLGTGQNMTFRNVSSVSVPSLEKLKGQLGFWGNKFQSFSAPNLTETSDLIFNDNSKLSNISMPVLKTVNGGFQIARSDKLNVIDFPKLETVTGAIDFSGEFNEAHLDSLKLVRGDFNMQSTGNISCTTFDNMAKNREVIKGTETCKTTSNPETRDGKSGSTTSTGKASATSTGAASALDVSSMPAMGLAAVFGALVQYAL